MKLTIPQPVLAAALSKGGAVAPKMTTIAIVSNVRLTAKADTLLIASTDLDQFAEASAECTVESQGATTVNAAEFIALIGRYPKDKDVSLELEDGRLIVKCGKSRVKFGTLPAEDFTTFGDMKPAGSFIVAGGDLAALVGRARVAAGVNDSRPMINGVYLHTVDGKLRAVGTDGHRLVLAEIDAPDGSEGLPGVILSTDTIDTALRVFKGAGEVTVEIGDSRIAFRSEGARLASKVIGGNYVEYTRVVPPPGGQVASFGRAGFAESMGRAVLVTEEGAFGGVSAFPAEGGFELVARNSKGGDGVEGVEAEVAEGFVPFAFNPVYMREFLAMFTASNLTIEQTAAAAPHRITAEDDPGLVAVLMPLKLPPSRAA